MSADSPHYYYNIGHQKIMKKIKPIDLTVFVILFLWVIANDFSVMSTLDWICIVAGIVYTIMFIIKLCMRGEE
ncbi:hypothetical protein ABH946_005793 [Bacillus sp. RC145]|uniref:hypothetical protein n=1 Tax=Bacillus sp. RC145 TaxID=3156280 RepID=UPI003833CAEC